jgi:hypothetical protein
MYILAVTSVSERQLTPRFSGGLAARWCLQLRGPRDWESLVGLSPSVRPKVT